MPQHWPFIKMHGLENYFVILDRRDGNKPLNVENIVRICSNNTGVGGEQLLTIEPVSDEGLKAGAYAAVRIFNIDGREVGACGNATRCMAYLLLEESGGDELLIELAGDVVHCRRAGPMEVSVTLGPISMDWRKSPLAREVDTLHLPIGSGPLIDGAALYIGNPHADFFVDRLDGVDMALYAPAVQNNPLFSDGANVGAAEIVNQQTLRLVVWERPGVLTKACRRIAMCFDAEVVMGWPAASRKELGRAPTGFARQNRLALMSKPVRTGHWVRVLSRSMSKESSPCRRRIYPRRIKHEERLFSKASNLLDLLVKKLGNLNRQRT
ncbi:diaminopimelate epimerase [Sinorhizobium medicae]|nr:diaminopimelate epimerase [Sinorhizobium medicae]MDX1238237.1 diaminopimelate epimerase [Sinorhizobium medicae]